MRPGRARNVVAVHGTTLFFMVDRTLTDGSPGFEIHAASPEDAPSRVLARIAASRAPQWQIVQPALSPDGQKLALPLTDGATTNIWTLSTATGEWQKVTDFGARPTFIARRVSWSSDGQAILAAVGEATRTSCASRGGKPRAEPGTRCRDGDPETAGRPPPVTCPVIPRMQVWGVGHGPVAQLSGCG